MKAQRGSAAVIAIIMMMFLLIVGTAWLPMLTQENTVAASDEKEQQAWYAAEAGFNRAKVELQNQNKAWSWLSVSVDKLQFGNTIGEAKYAVYVSGISPTSTLPPAAGTTYKITAVGQAPGGMQKVIKREVTLASSTDDGGIGGTDYAVAGAINAGGDVSSHATYAGSDINGEIHVGGMAVAEGMNIGDKTHTDALLREKLLTKIAAKWFLSEAVAKAKYPELQITTTIAPVDALPGQTYYANAWAGSHRLNGGSKSRIYLYPGAIESITSINGPDIKSKEQPFVVVVGKGGLIKKGGLTITGKVVILSDGPIEIFLGTISKGLVMLLSNDNVRWLAGNKVEKVFISSGNNITYNGGTFIGQVQAENSIDFRLEGGKKLTFDDAVLKAFGLPEGMT
ncbi:MAG: pilus assembly PilX N-terminal domain-containing protein [Acidaminococcaceae bacterium]